MRVDLQPSSADEEESPDSSTRLDDWNLDLLIRTMWAFSGKDQARVLPSLQHRPIPPFALGALIRMAPTISLVDGTSEHHLDDLETESFRR